MKTIERTGKIVMTIDDIKQWIDEKINNNCEVMLMHQGLGETCIFLFYAKAYTCMKGKQLALITFQTCTRTNLLRQCPYINDVLGIEEDIFYSLAEDFDYRLKKEIKNFLALHYIESISTKPMNEKIKSFLDLPDGIPFFRFNMPYSIYQAKIKKAFTSLNLKFGKTIFLIPQALFYGNTVVSIEFWEILCKKIKELGYDVIFNSQQPIVEGELYWFVPLESVVEFSEMCGNVVGVRTGLLDLIAAFSSVKIQAIFPGDDNEIFSQNDVLKKYLEIEHRGDYITNHDNIMELLSGIDCTQQITKIVNNDTENDINQIIHNILQTDKINCGLIHNFFTKVKNQFNSLNEITKTLLHTEDKKAVCWIAQLCQDYAYDIGTELENMFGNNLNIVKILEEYCEDIYQFTYNNIANDINTILVKLTEQLTQLENHIIQIQ